MKASRRFFKSFLLEIILNIPWRVRLELADVWLQDEERFGQQNKATRVWATKGTRSRVVRQQQFEYAYLIATAGLSKALTISIGTCVRNESDTLISVL